MAVEHKTNQMMVFSLTELSFHDSRKSIELVEEVVRASEKDGKKVKKVLADKGYDTHKMFNFLRDMGIEEGFKDKR